MNILQLISSGGFYGAESMMVGLCAGLRDAGHRVLVGVFQDLREPHVEVYEQALLNGLDACLLPCRGRWDRSIPGQLRRIIDTNEMDVVHCHGYKPDLYLASLRRGKTVFVSTCHSWTKRPFYMDYYAKLDRLALRRFNAMTAPSPHILDILADSGIERDRLTFIPNGIDLNRFSGPAPRLRQEFGWQDNLVVGIVGRLIVTKGGEFLIRAARQIVEQFPQVRFVFVGDGEERNSWSALAQELGVAEQVVFTGARGDMPAVYASCDVVALPSMNEAMPMVLLEAMSSRCPVVATTVGAIPQLIQSGEQGFLVPPANPDELAGAILALLKDPDLRRRMGHAGRLKVEAEYSSKAMTNRYLEIYKRYLPHPQLHHASEVPVGSGKSQ